MIILIRSAEKKISIAMGLAAAGSCVGGIVYILLVRHLLVFQGFAVTMIVLGSVAAVTMIPANLVFRVRGQSLAFQKNLCSNTDTSELS